MMSRTEPSDHPNMEFLRSLPKVELHLHLEGTLEPEMAFAMAERSGVPLRCADPAALRAAYRFADLRSFLDIYYEATSVLLTEPDFYDVTAAYLERAHAEGIRHTEVFFDPQTHTDRGVPFETVATGIRRALDEGERRLGITSRLIMCFLRDRSLESAWDTLDQARRYRSWITAVGLDSAEVGYPPELFSAVFAAARAEGWLAVAHAGEEGPPAYIWGALDALKVSRIDHGVRCLEDPRLVARLVADRIPLTVCPLSNVRLGVFPSLAEHDLRRMLDAGLRVTVNSDDPAYFGGYLLDNFVAAQQALALDREQIVTLVRNSYAAAFIDDARRRELETELAATLSREA